MELICWRLCEITHPRKQSLSDGRQRCTSRLKLALSEYNQVRARLLNSQPLLDDTNMMLYTINETTLTRWYKNKKRINDIRDLMQGLSLPSIPVCSTSSLPPAEVLPPAPPPPPLHPHIFEEPEDTSGTAAVQCSSSTGVTTCVLTASRLTASPSTVSRTTTWRHKKTGKQRLSKRRKVYTCRTCQQPMTTPGHTQFRGQRYCQHAPGQIPRAEWLAQRRDEAKARALSVTDAKI